MTSEEGHNPQIQGQQDPPSQAYRGHVEIRVRGHLDGSWSNWLGGLDVVQLPNGDTALTGYVEDQAALIGILDKLHRSNIHLISLSPAHEGMPEDTKEVPSESQDE